MRNLDYEREYDIKPWQYILSYKGRERSNADLVQLWMDSFKGDHGKWKLYAKESSEGDNILSTTLDEGYTGKNIKRRIVLTDYTISDFLPNYGAFTFAKNAIVLLRNDFLVIDDGITSLEATQFDDGDISMTLYDMCHIHNHRLNREHEVLEKLDKLSKMIETLKDF